MAELLSALKSTLVEMADSKKVVAAISTTVAAALVMIAGKLKLDWLDPDTAKLIGGMVVAKGAVYVLAQAHVDAKKEEAKAPPAVTVTNATGTSAAN